MAATRTTSVLRALSRASRRVIVATAGCSVLAIVLLGAAPAGASRGMLEEDECYGFAFGRWNPALDLRAAGHATERSGHHASAPGGRDWAAAVGTGRDTTLVLFPAWWPAGVHIHFPAGKRVAADTVRGSAIALVADGGSRPPRAEVLVWRIPCRPPAVARP